MPTRPTTLRRPRLPPRCSPTSTWHVTTTYDATGGVARLAEQVAAAAAAGNPALPQQAFDVNCTNAKPGT